MGAEIRCSAKKCTYQIWRKADKLIPPQGSAPQVLTVPTFFKDTTFLYWTYYILFWIVLITFKNINSISKHLFSMQHSGKTGNPKLLLIVELWWVIRANKLTLKANKHFLGRHCKGLWVAASIYCKALNEPLKRFQDVLLWTFIMVLCLSFTV